MLYSGTDNDNPVLSHFAKDPMKRTRRLSIEFRHLEVTITVQGSALQVQHVNSDTANVSTACLACGSPWFTMVAPADGGPPVGVDQIHRVLQQSGLHVQVTPTGELQICQRSFEELKEKH